MSNTEQFTHIVDIIYAALMRTFEEVKEPGKSALVIPLANYAQDLDTGEATLRKAIIRLDCEHRITARKLNYPSGYPETWEIVFTTPPLSHPHQAYTRPICEISDDEAATLNHLYSGIDA